MNQPRDIPDLDEIVAQAVTSSISTAQELEVRLVQALDGALTEARTAAARQGKRAGREVLDAYTALLERERAELTARLARQRDRLSTFNLVLFGRTGAGKSSLVEALSSGDGVAISQGESDWTTDVRDVRWRSCRLFDTPGIAGWGRTVDRAALERRAEEAVQQADVVLLCFDTQSQQSGEFDKVAAWVGRYGKPVVAVLNCRNGRWRFPARVPSAAARRQLSRSVHEHAGNIRDELLRIGLEDVPIVALHAKRAAFARTKDPFAGPDAPSRAKLRCDFGPDQLLEWSNLPALELLLTEALVNAPGELRLGMLFQQARGVLSGAAEALLTEHIWPAQVAAEQLERGIDDVLKLLGRPQAPGLARRLKALERLRGGFDVTGEGATNEFVELRLKALLGPVRQRATRAGEKLVDRAFLERRDLTDDEFNREVLAPRLDEAERCFARLDEELREYLERRLQHISEDVRADLQAAAATFEGGRGSAGADLRKLGIGLEAGAAGASILTGALGIAALANWWNPIGWTAGLSIAAGSIFAGLFGRKARREAAVRREQQRSQARASARRSVKETFDAFEVAAKQAATKVVDAAIAGRVTTEIDRATATRQLLAAAEHGRAALMEAMAATPEHRTSAHVLADAGRAVQRQRYPGEPAADRLLWLGEGWCSDPNGLSEELIDRDDKLDAVTARTEMLIARLRPFSERAAARPATGAGRDWLQQARASLSGDVAALAALQRAAEIDQRDRPPLVVAGDYSAGKSSFIKRLLIEAGDAAPAALEVSGKPMTAMVDTYPWGDDWDLVDTPGFQSSNAAHTEAAHEAIVGAAVLVVLFNPNLVVGDAEDLVLALHGDETTRRRGKLPRTLFVVNRADELGVDPYDDHEAFERLCARKELELTQALESLLAPFLLHVDRSAVLCVASDPYGMVGDRRDVGPGDYDAHRAWDGLDALRLALERLGDRASTNGVDVAILETGAARLGELAAARRAQAEVLDRQLNQARLLQLDLEACLQSGEGLLAAASEELAARLVEFVAGVFDEMRAAASEIERDARLKRLNEWHDDPEARQHVAEWSEDTQERLERWQTTTSERIERRLTSAAFEHAFVGGSRTWWKHPTGADGQAGTAREAARTAAQQAGTAGRQTVTKVAHRFGHKFKPWGATKLTSKVNAVGGALGLVLGGWELYRLHKSVGEEVALEQEFLEKRRQLLADVREAVTQSFDVGGGDDSPGAVIQASLDAVRAKHREALAALEERQLAREDVLALADECDAQANAALAQL